MRIGIIDLGTNSVRYDAYQIESRKRVSLLHREKLMIRLGQGVFVSGKLDPAAKSRAIQAFLRFRTISDTLRIKKIVAFGTSALREATDRDSLLKRIAKTTGIDVRIISGEEEARLIAEGILANEHRRRPRRFALVDIGGGSTEISLCASGKIVRCHSFPLGTARLQQIFLKRSPPSPKSFLQLQRFIRNTFYERMISEKWPKAELIFGSSGTIKAIVKIHKRRTGNAKIFRPSLSEVVELMKGKTTTELLGISGMEAKRVDMILAGAVLLEECMTVLGAKQVAQTDFSLRDGILYDLVRLYRDQESSSMGLHLPEIYQKAVQLGGDLEHLRSLVAVAETLFDRLKSLHRLAPHWKSYLTAATLLHKAGRVISPFRDEVHSYYIAKNADIPALEKWESEFVALLCLLQTEDKISSKKFSAIEGKMRRKAFVKLLSLLQLVIALDTTPKCKPKLLGVRVDSKTILLILSKKSSTGLEAIQMERRKEQFEKFYFRKLELEFS